MKGVQGIISAASYTPVNLWGDIVSAWEWDGDNTQCKVDEVGNYPITTLLSSSVTGVIDEGRGGSGNQQTNTGTPFSELNSAGDFTVMSWGSCHVGGGNGFGGMLRFSADSGYSSEPKLFFTFKNPDADRFYIQPYSGGANLTPAINCVITPDTWFHWALTYEHATTTWSGYHNGVFRGSLTGVCNTGNTMEAYWGYTASTAYSAGKWDLTRFFTRALSVDDIVGHYNGGAGLAYLAT